MAYSMLALIKGTFEYLDNHSSLRLYIALVRTHLEFANVVWHPYLWKDIDSRAFSPYHQGPIFGPIPNPKYPPFFPISPQKFSFKAKKIVIFRTIWSISVCRNTNTMAAAIMTIMQIVTILYFHDGGAAC